MASPSKETKLRHFFVPHGILLFFFLFLSNTKQNIGGKGQARGLFLIASPPHGPPPPKKQNKIKTKTFFCTTWYITFFFFLFLSNTKNVGEKGQARGLFLIALPRGPLPPPQNKTKQDKN